MLFEEWMHGIERSLELFGLSKIIVKQDSCQAVSICVTSDSIELCNENQ